MRIVDLEQRTLRPPLASDSDPDVRSPLQTERLLWFVRFSFERNSLPERARALLRGSSAAAGGS